ncbi:hypothetical protein HDU83_006360 [Entophlyctis luteolus]|nr:hypothetical protein HDU83_006360 [Entophlyctis luteolus]
MATPGPGSYLTANYTYGDAHCETPVAVITYSRPSSETACLNSVADPGCTLSTDFAAHKDKCLTVGFHENGLREFTSFVEALVYSAATCADSELADPLRQYRVDACYQYSGADGLGGLSRKTLVGAGNSSFVVSIFNDTKCASLFRNYSVVADGATCRESELFPGRFVKANLILSSSPSNSSSSAVDSGAAALSAMQILGVALGVIVFVLLITFGVCLYFLRKRRSARAQAQDVVPPSGIQLRETYEKSAGSF